MRLSRFAALLLALPLAATASETADIVELKAEVAALAARVAALEAENRALKSNSTEEAADETAAPAQLAAGLGSGRVRFTGDFRYRYEAINLEEAELRGRHRIRARAGLATDLADSLEVGFGLSTGGDSPVSSTQTLGGGGSKKDIGLDLAYVDWAPLDGLHLLAGKFRNPMFRVPSQTLLWDDEWRPEGFAASYDDGRIFATAMATWLESDISETARAWSVGAHAGLYRPVGLARLTAGIGYFDIDTEGKGTFYGADDEFLGNSRACADPLDTATCVYALDYREVEAFAALDLERAAFSAKLYGHYVENLDADRHTEGWTVGARFGTEWHGRPLRFDYFYRAIGADAVYAQLTNSDFGGGGTDAQGHYFKLGWKVRPDWQLSLTWFDNRVDADTSMPRDYNRMQLDANFTY